MDPGEGETKAESADDMTCLQRNNFYKIQANLRHIMAAEKALTWYERSFEMLTIGAAGGFVVAMAQELSTNGKVPLFLAILAIVYLFAAFWVEYKIYKRGTQKSS